MTSPKCDNVVKKFLENRHVSAGVRKSMAASKLNNNQLRVSVSQTKPRLRRNASVVEDGTLWNKIKDTLLDQRLAPLLADDLSSLPAAFVLTCQYDVLRDEGIMYAKKLKHAGNDATWCHSVSGYHGISNTHSIKSQPEMKKSYNQMIDFLKTRLI